MLDVIEGRINEKEANYLVRRTVGWVDNVHSAALA